MILCACVAIALGVTAQGRLVEPGPDFGTGVLVNASVGAHDDTSLDPSKLTFVIVHGLNPFHPLGHFSVGPRYAEALGRRFGSSVNVVYWDWNAVTTHGLSTHRVRARAVRQGVKLADALLALGLEQERLHVIG